MVTGLLCLHCHFNPETSEEIIEKREANFPKIRERVTPEKLNKELWLFILAGQSNMAGRGFVEPQDTVSDERIWSLGEDNQWYYAKEPLHFYEPKRTGLDCGFSFARELVKSIPDNVVIGLVPCAVGGSSISQWIHNEEYRGVKLLTNLSNRIDFATAGGELMGILWHQGESDSKTGLISRYFERIDTLFTQFRSQAGNDELPIFMGELGSYKKPIERQIKWDSINLMIRDYCGDDSNTYLIPTDDLTDKGDKVHFDSESQRLLGRKFAKKFIHQYKVLKK